MRQLPAGAGLDVLVAEHVMGVPWVWCRVPHPVRFLSTDNRYGSAAGTEPIASDLHNVPRYSTDLVAAWLVVDKLVALFPETQFTIKHRQNYHPQFWLVGWQVWRSEPGITGSCGWEWSDVFGRGEAETLPLAICRAALSAVAPLTGAPA